MHGFGKSERVGQLLLEYRVQKLNDELKRRFTVVMKNDLAVASLDLPITHWNSPPDEIDVEEPRTKQEHCHYPRVQKIKADTLGIFAGVFSGDPHRHALELRGDFNHV